MVSLPGASGNRGKPLPPKPALPDGFPGRHGTCPTSRERLLATLGRMEPDKAKHRQSKTHRDEYEVAYFTNELGHTLQRKMLQQQLEASGSCASSVAHGEDSSFDSHSNPPQHDRAG